MMASNKVEVKLKVSAKSREVIDRIQNLSTKVGELKTDLPWRSDIIDEMIDDLKFIIKNLKVIQVR